MTRLFLFVLCLVAVAARFYAGRKYKGAIPYLDQSQVAAETSPTPLQLRLRSGDDPLLKFEEDACVTLITIPMRGWQLS